MAKTKSTKGQTTIYKTLHIQTKDRVTRTPLKPRVNSTTRETLYTREKILNVLKTRISAYFSTGYSSSFGIQRQSMSIIVYITREVKSSYYVETHRVSIKMITQEIGIGPFDTM